MSIKSYVVCPVSDKKVNETVSRVNGFFTVLLLVIFGLTQSIVPVVILAFDFILRSFNNSGYSLIAVSSRGIVSCLGLKEILINAGPKIFAARVGLLFSCLIIFLFFVLKAYVPAFTLAGVLVLFSLFESVFGFCVACKIYPYLFMLLYKTRIAR